MKQNKAKQNKKERLLKRATFLGCTIAVWHWIAIKQALYDSDNTELKKLILLLLLLYHQSPGHLPISLTTKRIITNKITFQYKKGRTWAGEETNFTPQKGHRSASNKSFEVRCQVNLPHIWFPCNWTYKHDKSDYP